MKIGIDARMFSDAFTGIGRYTWELTRRFFEKCPDVQWVLFLNEPQFSQFDFPKNVKKVLVNAPHYSVAEQTKFLRILKKEKCDLVWFTHFNRPLGYCRPFVVTIHDTTISFFPGKKFNSWWRKLAYRAVISDAIGRSKKVITVSKNTAADVEKLFKISSEKIVPVWNGIGEEFGPQSAADQDLIRKKYGLEKFLLYTGVWREHKNLVGLLGAFALVRKKHPELKLVVTGKSDPNYPEVGEAIAKLGLDDAVVRPGLVPAEDLQRLYAAAEAYVFPSFYEGFGLPPLEAMAAGTPAVVSNVSAIPEVCGDAAEFFDPRDSEAMAVAISRVIDDPERAAELVRLGRDQVKKFSWDTAADETLRVLRSVVQF